MAKKKAGKGSAKQEAKELKKKKQEEKASKAAKKRSGKVFTWRGSVARACACFCGCSLDTTGRCVSMIPIDFFS